MQQVEGLRPRVAPRFQSFPNVLVRQSFDHERKTITLDQIRKKALRISGTILGFLIGKFIFVQ